MTAVARSAAPQSDLRPATLHAPTDPVFPNQPPGYFPRRPPAPLECRTIWHKWCRRRLRTTTPAYPDAGDTSCSQHSPGYRAMIRDEQ